MTKYNFLRNLACVGFCMALLHSCYEDKGNYTYRDIEEISIAEIADPDPIMIGQTLSITPQITISRQAGTEEDYTYEWIRAGHMNVALYTVLATSRDLVDFVPPLPGGQSYNWFLRVTSKKTGCKWMSNMFSVTILASEIGSGIFFLTQDGNDKGGLYLINLSSQTNKDLSLRRVIPSAIPEFDGPLSVVCVADNNSPKLASTAEDGRYFLGVFTKKGAYKLNRTTLEYDPIQYNIRNQVLGEWPAGYHITFMKPTTARNEGMGLFMDSNDNVMLYARSPSNIFPANGIYVNSDIDGRNRYKPSRHMAFFASSTGAVLFDETSKSFKQAPGRAPYTINYTDTPGSPFVFNNTNRDLLFMHGRATEGGNATNMVYALMKGIADQKYWLVNFQRNGNQIFERDLTAMIEMSDSKEYAMTEGNRNNEFFYYRTDTKIHLYNTSLRTNSTVYTATGTRRIALMRTIRDTRAQTTAPIPMDDFLMVFTYDPADPDNSGKLEVFEMTAGYGTLKLATYVDSDNVTRNMEWTGFGKVISADFKTM